MVFWIENRSVCVHPDGIDVPLVGLVVGSGFSVQSDRTQTQRFDVLFGGRIILGGGGGSQPRCTDTALRVQQLCGEGPFFGGVANVGP